MTSQSLEGLKYLLYLLRMNIDGEKNFEAPTEIVLSYWKRLDIFNLDAQNFNRVTSPAN
jgi:hypothetical protein